MLLQHRRGDLPRLFRLPVRSLVGDDLDLRDAASNTLKAASFMMTLSAAVSWPGMIATLPDLPLPAPHSLTMSSAISRPMRSQLAPTKALEGWLDCRLICSTLMPSASACLIWRASSWTVGLCDHQHVRLLADRLGQQFRHGAGVERGVADIERVAVDRRMLLHAARPAFGERDAHGDRHEDHLLAGDVGVGLRRRAQRERDAGAHQSALGGLVS